MLKIKLWKSYGPFYKDGFSIRSNYLYSNSFFIHPINLPVRGFNAYNNEYLVDAISGCLGALKNSKSVFFNEYRNNCLAMVSCVTPTNYATVLDSFRANYNEYSWQLDSLRQLKNTKVTRDNFFYNKFTNKLKLRAPAKNAVVTYNAIQKVPWDQDFGEERLPLR